MGQGVECNDMGWSGLSWDVMDNVVSADSIRIQIIERMKLRALLGVTMHPIIS